MPLPSVSGLAEPPSFGDLANFGPDANAFVGSLPAFMASVNALVTAMNSMGLGDLDPTDFAVQLLKANTAAQARTALELVKQESASDANAGRVMTPGAFGLGGNAITVSAANLNNVAASGFYQLSSAIANVLDAGAGVMHIQIGGTAAIQLGFRQGQDWAVWRRKTGNAWAAWSRLDPERVSNSNGEYVRFADGTQICTRNMPSATTGPVQWTFPAAFISTPETSVTPQSAGARCAVLDSSSPTAVTFSLYDTSGTRQQSTGRLVATGRWF